MSAETLQAVEDAIRAHVADVHGDENMLTDWIVSHARFDPTDSSYGWGYAISPMTSPHASVGLLDIVSDEMRNDLLAGVDDE